MFLSVIIILCAVPPAVGATVDRLLRSQDKGKLHDALLRYWLSLETLQIPDLPRAYATGTLNLFRVVLGKRLMSIRAIATIVAMSFLLTMSAFVAGACLTKYGTIGLAGFFSLFWGYSLDLIIGHPERWWPLFAANLPPDFLTCLITVVILRRIRRTTPIRGVLLAVLDVGAAWLLALTCLVFLFCVVFFSFGVDLVALQRHLGNLLPLAFRVLLSPWHGSAFTTHETTLDPTCLLAIYAYTTFIPTLICMCVLVTLIISRAVLVASRRVGMFYLETATEVTEPRELRIFTLTGSVFSAVGVVLTAIVKLWQLASGS